MPNLRRISGRSRHNCITSSKLKMSDQDPLHMATDSQEDSQTEFDIPHWLSFVVLFSTSSSFFFSLVSNSNPFLTSNTGYAHGGDMYSHQVEALYLKELLESGRTDLWFDELTLGYPLFLAYHPLPCLLNASLMILAESFISPLLMFRWMFVLLLSSMPWSWFIGLRKLRMTRLEATLAALFVHSIHSWRKFGLELEAFHEYGLFTQAYGMAILPLAVGFLYQYVLYNSGSRNGTILLIVFNFTANAFFGVYLGIVTGVTLLIDMLSNTNSLRETFFSPSIWRAFYVHFLSIVLLSWWIIPLLNNFDYMGGLPWKSENEHGHSFKFVLRSLLSGDLFDHERKIPFITLGFFAGLACVCSTQLKDIGHLTKRQTLLIWLGLLFSVTFFLFLGRTFSGPLYNLIPFHKELEVFRYIIGLQFCGLLLMAVTLAHILFFLCASLCRISKAYFQSKNVLIVLMLVFPPIYLSSQLQYVNARFSMIEIEGFSDGLEKLKAYPKNGRLLASKVLGLSGAWDLSLIPHLSKKPGIVTYSRGYHDTLSLYYLEEMNLSLDSTPWLPDLLRLYNIRFVATSGIEVPEHFLRYCELRYLATIGAMEVFVRDSQEDYGYFDLTHVLGVVSGDLKGMRWAVLKTTQLFTNRILFAINPSSELSHKALFKIVISDHNANASLIHRLTSFEQFETTWYVNGRKTSEERFFADVKFGRNPPLLMSRVISEKAERNLYSAQVEVAEDTWNQNLYRTEHLLIKVTYHPYWRCFFRSTPDDSRDQSRGWHSLTIHHVTPNLMSVVLPPGKHEVICEYKNPFYQKVGFGFFIVLVLAMITRELCKFLKSV